MTEITCPDCETVFNYELSFCKKCRYDFKNEESYQAEEPKEMESIKCTNCDNQNEGSKFCIMCGTLLFPDFFLQCANCNELNPSDAKFCGRCSEKLEAEEKIIPCPKCKNENKSPAKFCLKCGTELDSEITFCQSCGSKNHIEAKFCISCGKSVKKRPNNCPKCGAKFVDGMKFCMGCGTKIEEA